MDSTLLKIEDKEELVTYFCFPFHTVLIRPSVVIIIIIIIIFWHHLLFLSTLGFL